ncbi:response regulator [Cutibacterium namnetense]|uniref:Response regulator receiver domain protein n=1 Tax=[Propionibacterium] namnetense SK182B-JCVI TaxID=1051006 RepID=F9NVR5_9ACTN|nr:response regulator transcription factor [Cutibacterium namnetense]EGR96808.1 response regulator receiver domain protein [ [[Propionibacterium] namnetense SK182B-JCVI]
MVTILIVDDDPLVRAGLRLILGGSPSLQVVGEGSDGDEAVDLVTEHRPDVVLMDIRMPRVDGLEATRRLQALPEPPRIIVLTTFDSDDLVLRALTVGADGFLLKDTPPPRMVEAILQVAAGEQALSPSVVSQVIKLATRSANSSRQDSLRRLLEELTERERAVALAVGQGLTNAQIAKQEYLSVATVKAQITRILGKLGVTNRVQVALIIHDANLGELS